MTVVVSDPGRIVDIAPICVDRCEANAPGVFADGETITISRSSITSNRPLASTLNVDRDDTRANAAILPLGDAGRLGFYAQPSLDLLADTTGHFS